MEICKTDIKNIIQFLIEASELVELEVARKRKMGVGTLRLQNRARLMRLMTNKLSNKLKKEQDNDKK
jgi:hypothetical protein